MKILKSSCQSWRSSMGAGLNALPKMIDIFQFEESAIEFRSTSITIAATAVIGIMSLFWILTLHASKKKPHPDIPMLPQSHWLLGHLLCLFRHDFLDRQQALMDHSDQHGRCSAWFGPVPSISLTSKEDAGILLRRHHKRNSVPIFKYHFERLAGANNLLMLNGREWKYYQSTLKAALSRLDPLKLQRIARDTTQTLVNNLKVRIQNAEEQQQMGVEETIETLTKMITIDVFGKAAFSHDFGSCSSLNLCPFARSFEFMEEDVMDRCNRRAFLPQNLFYWIPTQRNIQFDQKRAYVRGFLTDIVRGRKDAKPTDDILQRIIEAHAEAAADGATPQPTTLSVDEDLIDVLLSILMAGYDTVSTALTYAIYLISRHSEWEERCLKEIRQAYTPNGDSACEANKKMELPLCQGVIVEALRLYPVATASARTLEKPLVLDGDVTIPKGYHCGVSFWLIHRSERYFPKPLEFRPDRWIDSAADGTTSDIIAAGDRNAFFAFSGGARTCPGQSFALNEATVALALLITNLQFHVDPNYEVEVEWKGIVQKPKGGIPATISLRK